MSVTTTLVARAQSLMFRYLTVIEDCFLKAKRSFRSVTDPHSLVLKMKLSLKGVYRLAAQCGSFTNTLYQNLSWKTKQLIGSGLHSVYRRAGRAQIFHTSCHCVTICSRSKISRDRLVVLSCGNVSPFPFWARCVSISAPELALHGATPRVRLFLCLYNKQMKWFSDVFLILFYF